MTNFLLYISWDVSPALYEGFITLRYYSLFFAISFLVGFQLVKRMYANYGAAPEWMDKLLVYAVVGTIVGARLGHVFFYDWEYYSENLIEIPMVWKGGLASHGAAIALIIAMWIFSRKITKKHTLWSLDKLVIAVALASGFIRMGNLMNSEIVGQKTESDLAIFYENKAQYQISSFFGVNQDDISFVTTQDDTLINDFRYPKALLSFPLNANPKISEIAENYANAFASSFPLEKVDKEADFFSGDFSKNYQLSKLNELRIPIYIIPRVPTQLYEALSYWMIFLVLFWGYWKQKWYLYEGRLFGVFLVLLFTSRFVVEFFKEHQTLADSSALTMGQYLSIPLVLLGLYFWIKSKRIDTN